GLPAIEQRQLGFGVFAGAAIDLLTETIFAQVAAADPIWILLQEFEDAIDLPAAADIMADDCVKHVRAISPGRRPFTYNLLDLIDAVPASAAVEAVSLRCGLFWRRCSLTAFAPHNGPIKYFVDVSERVNSIEPIAGDRQCFIGAPEQLSRNLLAVHVQRELGVDRVPFCQPPNTNTFAPLRDFL